MSRKLDSLKPKVKRLAQRLLQECKKKDIKIIITQTLRSVDEQNFLFAAGRTRPGKVVTNAKGGYSLHNYGVAFDFCPIIAGKAVYDNPDLFETVGKIGVGLGLEWGGDWKNFIDRPHFQFTAGYKLLDFVGNKIDWRKFQ